MAGFSKEFMGAVHMAAQSAVDDKRWYSAGVGGKFSVRLDGFCKRHANELEVAKKSEDWGIEAGELETEEEVFRAIYDIVDKCHKKKMRKPNYIRFAQEGDDLVIYCAVLTDYERNKMFTMRDQAIERQSNAKKQSQNFEVN